MTIITFRITPDKDHSWKRDEHIFIKLSKYVILKRLIIENKATTIRHITESGYNLYMTVLNRPKYRYWTKRTTDDEGK